MTNISLPECGLLVDGLPCKRWPGHLGACINENGGTAYIPPQIDLPVMPSPDDLQRTWRILIGGITMLLVILLGNTAAIIYLLVRLPCRPSKSESSASTAAGNSGTSSSRPRS